MSEATGISYNAAVAILLAATLLYTSIGGMRAVIWTDVVQFFVFAAVPAGLLLYTVSTAEGGLPALIETAAAHDKLRAFQFLFRFHGGDHVLGRRWSACCSGTPATRA